MRLTPVEHLRLRDRLGRDVRVGSSEVPLLRAGVRISMHYIQGLRRAGVRAVFDAMSSARFPVVSDRAGRQLPQPIEVSLAENPDLGVVDVNVPLPSSVDAAAAAAS